MEKWYVADSYKDFIPVSEPFADEKHGGRMYIKVRGTCSRCGGSGHYSYNSFDGTRCYGCSGRGYSVQTVRAYTEKEYNRMKAANERAKQRKEETREAKKKDAIENAAKYKHEIALKIGFGEDEKIYLVYGDDTFAIKDHLKELGARFDPTLKWYLPRKIDLPEGYKLAEFSFDELYVYNPITKWAEFKENAKEIVVRRLAELKGPSNTVYYPAAEKERIRNIVAKVANIRGFEGNYGYTFVYTFMSGDYEFVWMTTKSLDLSIGDLIDLTGTIKKFDEYMGEKQTHLTRCVVNKIGK